MKVNSLNTNFTVKLAYPVKPTRQHVVTGNPENLLQEVYRIFGWL